MRHPLTEIFLYFGMMSFIFFFFFFWNQVARCFTSRFVCVSFFIQAMAFCQFHNVAVSEKHMILKRNDFYDPEELMAKRRAPVQVESKRQGPLGQVCSCFPADCCCCCCCCSCSFLCLCFCFCRLVLLVPVMLWAVLHADPSPPPFFFFFLHFLPEMFFSPPWCCLAGRLWRRSSAETKSSSWRQFPRRPDHTHSCHESRASWPGPGGCWPGCWPATSRCSGWAAAQSQGVFVSWCLLEKISKKTMKWERLRSAGRIGAVWFEPGLFQVFFFSRHLASWHLSRNILPRKIMPSPCCKRVTCWLSRLAAPVLAISCCEIDPLRITP